MFKYTMHYFQVPCTCNSQRGREGERGREGGREGERGMRDKERLERERERERARERQRGLVYFLTNDLKFTQWPSAYICTNTRVLSPP